MGLSDKLRFNKSLPLILVLPTDEAISLFEGMEIRQSLAGKNIQQIILFALSKKTLDTYYPKITSKLADNAVFWIAYPKKSSNIKSDLVRDEGWEIVFHSDFQIVTSVSIDDTWTGMRIKKKDPKAQYKREVPIAERKTEGIDYVKRTVVLPKDAIAAMKPHHGLEEFFNSMAFTHKKEYVESIVDAKKPETRIRRIEKMVEMVSKLKMEKEIKKKK